MELKHAIRAAHARREVGVYEPTDAPPDRRAGSYTEQVYDAKAARKEGRELAAALLSPVTGEDESERLVRVASLLEGLAEGLPREWGLACVFPGSPCSGCTYHPEPRPGSGVGDGDSGVCLLGHAREALARAAALVAAVLGAE